MNINKINKNDEREISCLIHSDRNKACHWLMDIILENAEGFIVRLKGISIVDYERVKNNVLNEYINDTNMLLRLYDYKIEREEKVLHEQILKYFELSMKDNQIVKNKEL